MGQTRERSVRSGIARAVCGLCVIALAGCGGTGSVQGTVTVDGQPAAGSLVILSCDAGGNFPARVAEDGGFKVEGVPVGPARVVVLPNDYPVSKAQTVPVAIPARYRDVTTSGLALVVARGTNQFPITMTTSKP